MKKTIYLLLSIIILSCSEGEFNESNLELNESNSESSYQGKYVGTLPIIISGSDDVDIKMYFEGERHVDGIEYAGIEFTSVNIHNADIEIIVDYSYGGNQRIFVPQYFRIKANERKSNKLWNVSALDMFGDCPKAGGSKKITMKIREVKYGGTIINNYSTSPTSGSKSNTFYTFCQGEGSQQLDYDHDGVDNIKDDCPYTSGGDDDKDKDGCPD